MTGSTFDDASRAPEIDVRRGEVEWVGPTGEVGYRSAAEFAPALDGRGPDGCSSDDAGLVDAFGKLLLPPDHSEQELAAILATNPYIHQEEENIGPGPAGPHGGVRRADGGTSRGVSGACGGVVVVDVTGLLLEDVDHLPPGVALVSTLQNLTGLETRFGTGDGSGGVTHVTDTGERAPASLDDGDLRRVIAGWERVASWVRAAQARVAAELMTRTDGPLGRDSAAGEIAAELHVTSGEGWQIAMRGEGTSRYPRLAEALTAGHIDAKKVDTFLRAGTDLTPQERGEAIEDLLPSARTRTWRWVSEQLNARAAVLHGRRARQRDVVERCNVWAEPAGPGMGRIVADMPVVDAARTFNTVQAAAKALKDVPGEARPLGTLRAAALAALVTGRLVLPCPADETDDNLDGTINESHNGSDDAADNRDADHDKGGRNHGDNGGRDGEVVEPPRLVEPVLDTDLIPVPHDRSHDPHGSTLTGSAQGSTDRTSSRNTGSQNVGEQSIGNQYIGRPNTGGDTAALGTRIRVVDVTTVVNVTVPATMLLDPGDITPGILEGIGPIPADTAARIAADSTWRRLLTDPVTGVLTDYSTRTYAPGATLRAAVGARDRTCRFPGCDRPALAAGRTVLDLDHIDAFDHDHDYAPSEPGQTRATNLHALCRRHHNLKTHANWSVSRDADTGITHWSPPSGVPAVVEPTITDPTIRYALAHGMTLATPPATASAAPGDEEADQPRGRHPGAPPF